MVITVGGKQNEWAWYFSLTNTFLHHTCQRVTWSFDRLYVLPRWPQFLTCTAQLRWWLEQHGKVDNEWKYRIGLEATNACEGYQVKCFNHPPQSQWTDNENAKFSAVTWIRKGKPAEQISVFYDTFIKGGSNLDTRNCVFTSTNYLSIKFATHERPALAFRWRLDEIWKETKYLRSEQCCHFQKKNKNISLSAPQGRVYAHFLWYSVSHSPHTYIKDMLLKKKKFTDTYKSTKL